MKYSRMTAGTLAAVATVLSTAPAYADLGDQLAKLLPNDGDTLDQFGWSVAISGPTAIVGAIWDDDNGTGSGSAYLFDTSDPANPTQLFKLLPNDGAAEDQFGVSVAISGATAIVGAWRDDDNGTDSGSAYLFDINTGQQIAKLLANDGAADDRFGRSVALSGTLAIVGAPLDDDNGANSGSAYVFDISDPANPAQLFKLLADDGAAFDGFGVSVAISGTTAIVGAWQDDDNGPTSGSAYLFDTTTGRQIAKLLPNDGAAVDRFGLSVAISGATAIVGAWGHDDNGNNSGSAYLFDTTTGAQIAELLPVDGAADNHFGISVAISPDGIGTTAIVGARWDDDNGAESGSAYLFDISDPANPVQTAKLLPNDGARGHNFGQSVAISGATGKETAIVGAFYDDDNGSASGSAYLFDAAAPGMCPWDLDASGVVGVADFLELLGAWGPCPPKGGCPADFDGSGDVGVSDFLELLGNWGPCP